MHATLDSQLPIFLFFFIRHCSARRGLSGPFATRIQGRMQFLRFFIIVRVFENYFSFLDLISSKDCTHEYKLLNFSDLKKVAKTFFKNAIYQSETNHIFLAKEFWSQCHILRFLTMSYDLTGGWSLWAFAHTEGQFCPCGLLPTGGGSAGRAGHPT